MKITVDRNELALKLRKLLSVVGPKTTIPVLNNVLLETDDGKLALTTTDLEVCIRTTIAAVVEQPGSTTLPAKKFGQIVGVLPDGEIQLETDAKQTSSISCQKAFFRIVGLDPSEFPRDVAFEGTWAFDLPAIDFRKALSKVSYAVSIEDTRQVLNGILLSLREGVLTVVATDGRRLALIERPLEIESVPDGDVILPGKVVGELEKVLADEGTMSVQLSESRASFAFGDTLITSKLVDGTYPNYRQVIPGSFTQSASIPRELFAEVLNRVSMVVSETSSFVRLRLESGSMVISATSTEVGEGTEPMDVSYEGDSVEIAFNPAFLSDPLRNLESDQVIMQFNDQFSPMSLSGDEGFLYVIMPMRG